MDPNNRLYLNFGNNNERLASSDRQFPTTPSTFPQPVFPGQPSGGPPQPHAVSQQYAGGAYPPSNSNMNHYVQAQYQQQYAPQQHPHPNDYLGGQSNVTHQPRSNTPGNDPNVGLAHQFSHQNLGGNARANAYGQQRGAAQPGQRPRTAGSSGQPQPSYNYMNAPPMPASSPRPMEFQPAPERTPEKYGTNANNNQKKCSQLAADFFKDSVKRARERNLR
jgi:protein-serine/threonine kinase